MKLLETEGSVCLWKSQAIVLCVIKSEGALDRIPNDYLSSPAGILKWTQSFRKAPGYLESNLPSGKSQWLGSNSCWEKRHQESAGNGQQQKYCRIQTSDRHQYQSNCSNSWFPAQIPAAESGLCSSEWAKIGGEWETFGKLTLGDI